MKICYSEGKLMKEFGNPPLSKRTPLVSTNPLFLTSFFMTLLFVQISKLRNPSNFRAEETMCCLPYHVHVTDTTLNINECK